MSDHSRRTTLKLLSYNIQVGIDTRRYSDYITRSWRHFLPYNKRQETLHAMSRFIKGYDIVALQEADGGSLRSSYVNQVSLLAQYAEFPHWHQQCTRNIGRIAQHSNGLLSKIPLNKIIEHKLPGVIPGRGAIEAHVGDGSEYLQLFVVHLALSYRVRKQQIAYLANQMKDQQYVILMGDFNCPYDEAVARFATHGITLHQPFHNNSPTYPSWKPVKQCDHILLSPGMVIKNYRILDESISDHLPVELEVLLPESIITSVQHDLDSEPLAQRHGM